MRLHLIRHGQTDWNAEQRCQGQSESSLDATGMAQAEALNPMVRTLPLRNVYTSSSQRTRQTTERLIQGLSHEPVLMDTLKEIYLADWETRLWADIQQQEPHLVEDFRDFPARFEKSGAETYADVQQRGCDAIEHIISMEQQRSVDDASATDVLIVSHGLLLRAALAAYAGITLEQMQDIPQFPNCSHSILRVDGSNRHIEQLANHAYVNTAWYRHAQ